MRLKPALIYSCMLLFSLSCKKQPSTTYYSQYEPVMLNYGDLPKSVVLEQAHTGGNIIQVLPYGNLILALERYKGVHVYDNTDKANPVAKGFLKIAGCTSIAAKDNILYADNSVDLVAIDMNTWQVVNRQKQVFSAPAPPDGSKPLSIYSEPPANTVVIDWNYVNTRRK